MALDDEIAWSITAARRFAASILSEPDRNYLAFGQNLTVDVICIVAVVSSLLLCLSFGCLLGCCKKRKRHFYTVEDGMVHTNLASDGAAKGNRDDSTTTSTGKAE